MKSGNAFAALLLSAAAFVTMPGASRAQDAQAPRKERDLITRAEIESSAQHDQDLYSAIRSLRPHFLQPPRGNHGAVTAVATALYVNGSREPYLDALRRISASLVTEVRYLDPGKAEMEYGSSAQGGAIVVKITKPGEQPPDAR